LNCATKNGELIFPVGFEVNLAAKITFLFVDVIVAIP
jgi:hypothetical protein